MLDTDNKKSSFSHPVSIKQFDKIKMASDYFYALFISKGMKTAFLSYILTYLTLVTFSRLEYNMESKKAVRTFKYY